ncbi:hypothetical protein AAFF_G00095060 [Aldrovandia affinis]|uniref:Uncharacterized protein n=1 Tax=Aldrovandia affinis TaxID=143900 RepID=A0AAD7RVS1_9TELE|nr:hypothetical protein AAFF_G00095060 [Aldrovandia affinis]
MNHARWRKHGGLIAAKIEIPPALDEDPGNERSAEIRAPVNSAVLQVLCDRGTFQLILFSSCSSCTRASRHQGELRSLESTRDTCHGATLRQGCGEVR